MLERLGIQNRTELLILASLILLVAVSPLGSEGTEPFVLFLYRSLLFIIVIACGVRNAVADGPSVNRYFLAGAAAVMAAMLGSVLLRPGSQFQGLLIFYKNLLFLAAFISLAQFNRSRSTTWKSAVLASVVVIDVVYVMATLSMGSRPLTGPFVNSNYFASFLLVGLAACVAAVLAGPSSRIRIAAAAAGIFVFYGIGQTSSRGATLAAFAVFGLALSRALYQRRISWKLPVVVVTALLLITITANGALIKKFLDTGQRDPYNYQRASIWLAAVKMVSDNPLFGVGLDRYRYLSKLYTPPVEGGLARFGRWPNMAHSEYLQQVVDIGIPAALLEFGLIGSLLFLAWKRTRSAAPEERIFHEAALYAAVGIGAHALVDNNFTVPVLAAGMAVISQANLLPYRQQPSTVPWSRFRVAGIGLLLIAVYAHSTVMPAMAFYWNQAGNHAQAVGDFARAERMHRLALAVARNDAAVLDNIGVFYLEKFRKTGRAEDLDRAESFFSRALTANPNFEIAGFHLETVWIQRLTGDAAKDRPIHVRIVETDRQILKTNPFNPFIRKNLAEALYNSGDRQGAMQELLNVVGIEPNYVPAYFRLAEWLKEQGQTDASERYRQKAVQIVIQYQGKPISDPFEALLLGRPQ